MNQSIITCIFFSIAGYLSGSILYAYWIPKILFQKDICALSPDGNPGTAGCAGRSVHAPTGFREAAKAELFQRSCQTSFSGLY